VAVHYRGLDKVRDGKFQEAERLNYTDVLALVDRLVRAHNCTAVLAASDEAGFVEAALKAPWGVTDSARAVLVVAAPGESAAVCNHTKGCGALHLSEMSNNYRKTREAAETMVLLSRCTHLVSPSFSTVIPRHTILPTRARKYKVDQQTQIDQQTQTDRQTHTHTHTHNLANTRTQV